ncbi:sigma factor-like helix-turn-helix DNA-binding protein [Pseudarthrobacter cellobiosi]|uniref:sigma factor-like helix-turn-helix DNA-binding protein n=1 Tax=Pseudarthrobacter cellobiosi TaxID=2953654 RepID=UPI00208FA8F3|nr:sigma factor-like helix-turn-helix DNA-binding protein [Pseudarthrobacter sp. HLT1-5]MCO4255064.1 ECF-type sigma factor [Pseudarthrobacter sp. HLT1-5]
MRCGGSVRGTLNGTSFSIGKDKPNLHALIRAVITKSRREASQVALASLSTISAGQSEAIALAYFGGQTYAEVAAALNLSLPAVKARIRDGFRNLRHSMGPAGAD